MKLKFIFLGKKNPSVFDSVINNYINRLNHYVKSECIFLNDKSSIKLEQKILIKIGSRDCLIVMDELGKSFNTLKFSKLIQKTTLNYNSIIFLVGGAYGVSEKIKNKSHYILSLSEMTLPHMIARLILVEQTYRAFTIFNNHPYHHE